MSSSTRKCLHSIDDFAELSCWAAGFVELSDERVRDLLFLTRARIATIEKIYDQWREEDSQDVDSEAQDEAGEAGSGTTGP